MRHYLYWITAALVCSACSSQNGNQVQEPAATVTNPDGTVTFNYRNDNAQNVEVDVQFAGRQAMHKDSVTGYWTVTLGPAAPDLYPYHYVVDGVSVMDPRCERWFPNEGFKNSLLDVQDSTGAQLYNVQNVPHGTVEYIHYYSETIGGYNNAIVCLPPSYYMEARSYPVFYLISGTTDTEEVYFKVGRVNNIMDNLLAQNKIAPMIIVLPYGNPAKLAGSTDIGGRMDWFKEDFLNSLVPYIDAHYRTFTTHNDRAIGGFSRGGNQALSIGLTNLDKFSYLCSYSSFTSTDLPKVYDNANETNSKINLFWSGVGTDDFLYGTARDYTEFLDKKGIRNIKEYTDDKFGHTWMNARYFLTKTLPLLFNYNASRQAMSNAQPTKAATGQEAQFTPGVMARLFPRPIISPEFKGDSVTFRFKAPEAKAVSLEGEMLAAPQVMQLDTDGVWSITLAVKPDIYCYNFNVDGTQVCDPQNMYLAAESGFKRSVLNMPNDPYAINNMRGDYGPVRYTTTHRPDGAYVRTITITPNVPAGSFMHSINLVGQRKDGNTVESWFKNAHVNLVLEQLVSSGQCKPTQLVLSEEPLPNMKDTLDAANFKTWSEARMALINTLKSTK